MSESVQYVTNQQGESVGVLLDLETYNQLTNSAATDDGDFEDESSTN